MSFENVFVDGFCEIWLRLVPGGFDLDLEEYEKATVVGERPDWLDEDIIDALGLDGLLPDYSGCGYDAPRMMTWGLQYGICPYQPFLVRVDKPEWYQSGGYEYPSEWDIEFGTEIIAIERRTPKQAITAWTRVITERSRLIARRDRRERALRAKQISDVDAMFLQYDSYWSRGLYSEMSPADGAIVKLMSKHDGSQGRFGALVLSERHGDYTSYHENRDAAWKKLLDRIRAELPHLDIYKIEKLERRHS